MRFLLDTNILIRFLANDAAVVEQLNIWRDNLVLLSISTITVAEILAQPSLTGQEQIIIRGFLDDFLIIPVDTLVAEKTAELRRANKISLGDSIITATAIYTQSVLVTNDKPLIKNVSNLVKVQSIN